jgi:hypothetical protein
MLKLVVFLIKNIFLFLLFSSIKGYSNNVSAEQTLNCKQTKNDSLLKIKLETSIHSFSQITLNTNLGNFQDHIVFTPQIQFSPRIYYKKRVSANFNYAVGAFKQELDFTQYGLINFNFPDIYGALIQRNGYVISKSFGLSYFFLKSNKLRVEAFASLGSIQFNQTNFTIKSNSKSGSILNNDVILVRDKFNNFVTVIVTQIGYQINNSISFNFAASLEFIQRGTSGVALEFPSYYITL